MQIRYIPPNETDAKVEIKEGGEVIITPRFAASNSSAIFGSVLIKGAGGKERRFLLAVSGRQGRISAYEAKSVEPDFDREKEK